MAAPDIRLSSVPAEIDWDDYTMERVIEPAQVYLVPLETTLSQSHKHETLELQGLIVAPTWVKKGQ
ncbi:hypothetical protein E8E12_000084, partial [Didymella heteroderae]